MKNMKIDEKSKFLSAVLMSLLLIGLAFFFGYKKFEEKATSFNNQNYELEQRIKSLETYYITEEQNKKDTEAMTKEIAAIFSKYDSDARFEDGIYEAFNLYNGSLETLELSAIGFSSPYAVKSISWDTVNNAQIEGYNEAIDFVQFDVVYDGKITYEGLKSMVDEIAGGKYNLAIANMSYHINESAYIEGSNTLSFYSVKGAGCPYTEPPVEEYEKGLENLFGVNGTVIKNADEED